MRLRISPVMLLVGLASGHAATAGPSVLEWSEKSPSVMPSYVPPQPMAATTPPAQAAQPYAAPPSPYGTVGDPFTRRLTWGARRVQAPLPPTYPVQAYPVQSPPVQPIVYAPAPERPRPSVIMPQPVPAPALPLDLPPPPVPSKVKATPAPEPQATVPQRDGVYQIPQTSKYYKGPRADIAAEVSETPAPLPQPNADTNPAELPFVPGEIARDPRTQSSRVYSLHRQYGLTPDAISSVSDHAPNPADTSPKTPPKKP